MKKQIEKTFPIDFYWGAASSAYQVEGAANEDGKGKSVWDMMCQKQGAIWKGQNGDIACDHYHRSKEDVALMKSIGLKAYRMSISWPRVLPDGIGKTNQKGLDFYDHLIDDLLNSGITPFITLFHWDFPYALYCRGGWLNPESSNWFAEYTAVLAHKLSDRVKHWITLNEPQCFIGQGHQDGFHAPGDRLGTAQVLQAGQNALLAHGKAVQTLRAISKQPCMIGYAPVGAVKIPNQETAEDINAARTSMFSITEKNYWNNTWWMDPVLYGKYPQDGLAIYGTDVPTVSDDQMKIISEPIDFLGLNIYHGRETTVDSAGHPIDAKRIPGYPITTYDWPITPSALYWGPKFFYERYQKPILITENGIAINDFIFEDNKVHDPQRIDYLSRYLKMLKRALDDGIDIRGYFVWSIMDNFEWNQGFKQRFGLIYVDYPTQKRILKDSAYWYQQVIESNGQAVFTASYVQRQV